MERNGELSTETPSGSNPASPDHSFLHLPTNHPSFTTFRHSVYPQHLALPFYYPVLPMSSGSTPDYNSYVPAVSCSSGVACNGRLCNDCTAARQPYYAGSGGTHYPQISFGDGSGM